MAVAVPAPFVMRGARDAIGASLLHIDAQVRGIEQAVVENPGLAFDLARTLVESVCRTILRERSIAYSDDDSLPRLFKIVTNSLPLLPPKASGEVEMRKSLARTLGGLSTALQGICELRNRGGFASHGDGAPRSAMESSQALLAAEAADTIVGFLHRVHCQGRTQSPVARALYEDNVAFNGSIDESHDLIRIFELEFLPSAVLFEMEPETYRIYLAEFEGESDDDGAESTP